MVMTSMRQRDEGEGERRDPRPDHPNEEDRPCRGGADERGQPSLLPSARFSEKCHDRPAEERRHDVSQRTAEEREECMEDCHRPRQSTLTVSFVMLATGGSGLASWRIVAFSKSSDTVHGWT